MSPIPLSGLLDVQVKILAVSAHTLYAPEVPRTCTGQGLTH
ncbi:hypothetical protein L914_15466 [Phytophthora nicotianae]|uniref:Uncharacterized protein n=1 Tax=Phytophthora nicotianae TaxID=4792 RepID=W2MP64_PHYNI|nr:hypothetical protein L914_15466 [Phytophthora nicotianae]